MISYFLPTMLGFLFITVNVNALNADNQRESDFCLTFNGDDYDDDRNGHCSSYDAICDQMPEKKMPFWRVLLNKIGSNLLLGYMFVKKLWPLSGKDNRLTAKKIHQQISITGK